MILSLAFVNYTAHTADNQVPAKKLPAYKTSISGFLGEKMEISLIFPIHTVTPETIKNATLIPQGSGGILNKHKNKNSIMISGEFNPCVAIVFNTDDEVKFIHMSINNDIDTLDEFFDAEYKGKGQVVLFAADRGQNNREYFSDRQFIKGIPDLMKACINKMKQLMPKADIEYSYAILPLTSISSILGNKYLTQICIMVDARGGIFHVPMDDVLLDEKNENYFSDYQTAVKMIESGMLSKTPTSEQTAMLLLRAGASKIGTKLKTINSKYVNENSKFCLDKDGKLITKLVPLYMKEDVTINAAEIESAKICVTKADACAVCQKPSRQKCSACKSVHYCSRECQAKDWSSHKTTCKKL